MEYEDEEEQSYPWETEGDLPYLTSSSESEEPWAAEIDEPWLAEEVTEEVEWEQDSPGWPEESAGPEYWLNKDQLE